MFLAGDIGGTKVRLSLFSVEGARLSSSSIERYECKNYPSFDAIIQDFLSKISVRVEAACIGVAGPVADGAVRATNLPWELSEKILSSSLGIPHIKLVNDLVATASVIPHLCEADVVTLYSGCEKRERRMSAVVAPGTGLGQATILHEGGAHYVISSEGGHIDFAPTNDTEYALLKHLQGRFKRVSVERLLSGPGILNIYDFYKTASGIPESSSIAERMERENPSAVISQAGIRGEDELCMKTMDLFTSVLGSHCGNVVLTFMSTAGVYLGGGIPPKIIEKLSTDLFLDAYRTKGRLSPLVEATPVMMIKDDHAALHGAAWIARDLLT